MMEKQLQNMVIKDIKNSDFAEKIIVPNLRSINSLAREMAKIRVNQQKSKFDTKLIYLTRTEPWTHIIREEFGHYNYYIDFAIILKM